jgi:hypothetical protein
MIGLELSPRTWFSDIGSGHFTRTVFTAHRPGSGWLAIAPFMILLAVALVTAAAAAPWPTLRRSDVVAAGVVLAAWSVLGSAGPSLVERHSILGDAALAALAITIAAAAVLAVRRTDARAAPAASALG